jgi:tRNA1Val (adenine37-N6)-methyltransferase
VSEAGLSRDAFLGGRVMLWQPLRGYRAATDPVLLAAAVPARTGERVLDLGCGAGAAALCLAARVGGLDLHGLEIQPDYADLARRNAAGNAVALSVHQGDAGSMPPALRALSFDHVLTNPPFFAADAAMAPRDAGRDTAHRESGLDLAGWIDAALRRLRPGGWLTVIHRAERLPDLLAVLQGRSGSTTVLPLCPREDRPAGRVILRTRKGGRGPFRLLAPLVMHAGPEHSGDRDDFSPRAVSILRNGAALAEFET